ncbi:MAG TPA: hypothetical protein VGK25_13290 [Ignavibacteria bacterium]
MKKIIYVTLFILLIFFISCQKDPVTPPVVTHTTQTYIFANSFGTNVSDLVVGARQSIDGGIVICGYTIASQFGDNDIFVTKLDTAGYIVWSKIIGSSGNDQAAYMDTTSDGGFIIVGSSNSFSATNDPVAIKIDNSGNMVWSRYYFWNNNDVANYVYPTSDFGYIITGSSNSIGAGGYDVYAMKIDVSGAIMWCRAYGGPLDDVGAAIKPTQDGGYIIAGNTFSFGNSGDIYIIKTFGDGGYNWSKNYGGLAFDFSRDIMPVAGGYVICGSTLSFGVSVEDAYVFSIDNNGFLYWSRTFGGLGGEDDRFFQMKSVPGGEIILSGSIKNNAGNDDFCLLRLYGNGAFNWMKTYGGAAADISTSVANKSEGGFIAAGNSSSYGAGSNDAYVVSVKSDGTGCLPNTIITPIGGDPATDVGSPQTIYNNVNYETRSALFNIADFNVVQNTQCTIIP